jgi:hypothetical protein
MMILKETISMIAKMHVALALAAFTLTANVARAESSQNLSRPELKKMVQSAHSPDQYQELASYFRWQQQVLKEKAHSELAEWDRRSRFVGGLAEKYPRPVDSSRNRYQYFCYEEQKMGQKAAHYEQLMETAAR